MGFCPLTTASSNFTTSSTVKALACRCPSNKDRPKHLLFIKVRSHHKPEELEGVLQVLARDLTLLLLLAPFQVVDEVRLVQRPPALLASVSDEALQILSSLQGSLRWSHPAGISDALQCTLTVLLLQQLLNVSSNRGLVARALDDGQPSCQCPCPGESNGSIVVAICQRLDVLRVYRHVSRQGWGLSLFNLVGLCLDHTTNIRGCNHRQWWQAIRVAFSKPWFQPPKEA